MTDFNLTENFRVSEFLCQGVQKVGSCACHGAFHPNSEHVAKALQLIRDEIILGPMLVLSAFRCEFHNERVGGHPRSWHRLGLAADIAYLEEDQEETAKRIGIFLEHEYGDTGQVIWYPGRGFIHIDLGTFRPEKGRVRMNETAPKKVRGY